MRVLIVGSGAREHAIAWKLSTSPQVKDILIAPGNGGTAAIGTNLPIAAENLDTLVTAATRYSVDLTVLGPEAPLAAGIVDRFQQSGLIAFGPTKGAAKIEASKAYARELMKRHHVPSPDFKVFRSYSEGYDFLSKHEGPLVVKADGLADGKGSFICNNQEEAINALHDCMEDQVFGAAGATVVVEELLQGQEVSVFAFVDGYHVSSLMAACDYKRLLDRDKGPNTGGMGSYAPVSFWSPEMAEQVRQRVMEPVVQAMAAEGVPFRGVLYAGLMITPSGPKVLEFNCRLGDPEAQVIFPLLKTDLVDLMLSTIKGSLNETSALWGEEACVGVVMASRGYPRAYRQGFHIEGLDSMDKGVLIFHAGTRRDQDNNLGFFTTGGRVLTLVGRGPTVEEARSLAYENIQRVSFPGCQYRKDIALLYQEVPVRREGF